MMFNPVIEAYTTPPTLDVTGSFLWGLAGKTAITLPTQANILDSYNSTDPNYSTSGTYDVTKRKDRFGGLVSASAAGTILSIGNSGWYGNVYCTRNHTTADVTLGVNGSIGDAGWVAGSNFSIQPGHFKNVQLLVPSVTGLWTQRAAPYGSGVTPSVVSSQYQLNNPATNWFLSTYTTNNGLFVKGANNRLVVTAAATMGTGNITFADSTSSLQVYWGNTLSWTTGITTGSAATISGSTYWHLLPKNTRFYMTAGSAVTIMSNVTRICCLHAPSSAVTVTGGASANFSGYLIGSTFTFSNAAQRLHYDEALTSLL